MALVSVIIPSYNRWKFLQRALKSVFNQTYQNVEIIVIDDCSTQQEYIDYNENHSLLIEPKPKWIRLPQNLRHKHKVTHTQGLTRNEGIAIAQGEYLAFLDDDDFWAHTKLEKQMAKMLQNPSCLMSFTNGYRFPYDNQLFFMQSLPEIFKRQDIEQTNYIINSAVVIQKKLVVDLGGFRVVPGMEDYDLWKRAMEHTNCLYLAEPLMCYDMNHGNGIYYNDMAK